MRYLAKCGFTQSYTYFTWRNTKEELTEYFTELTRTPAREYMRPNLFTNTPDILHEYLQQGGRPAFQARFILAATLGASYGIYSGYELIENIPVKAGSEEYLDSEKYQIRPRDFQQPHSLSELITRVNRIRRDHRALQRDWGLRFHQTDNPHLLAYSKRSEDGQDLLIIVVNLDPFYMQHGFVEVPFAEWGFDADDPVEVVDLLSEERYFWRADRNYVRLDPQLRVAHILTVPLPDAAGGRGARTGRLMTANHVNIDPLWYKDAVIYQAHVRAFFDSTNDGIGDFAGLTQKLPYLESLGVNCLWLLPFYPSPLRDDGYDIADYTNIHPSYGTLADFDRFIEAAHGRGLRVITELVINHTSDQHPWFQAARRAPAGSPERDFYVWSDTNRKYEGVRIIFTDTETSNWSWDDTAGRTTGTGSSIINPISTSTIRRCSKP